MPGSVEYHEFANRRIRMTGMKVDRGPLIDLPLFRFREVLQEERVMIGAIYREDRLIIPSGPISFGRATSFTSSTSLRRCLPYSGRWSRSAALCAACAFTARDSSNGTCEKSGVDERAGLPDRRECRGV